jgi:two-component system cell cycle response regulator DivK
MVSILIVEDNPINQDVLSRLLTRRGYTVYLAQDGAEGVAMAREHSPNVVLMDVGLPVIDGYEATRRIKADPETAMTPIIALTARAMSTDRDEALAAGCDEFEVKPIDLPRLLAKIEALRRR